MRILYYTWGECTFRDCTENMQLLGWQVDVISYVLPDYDYDENFMQRLQELLKTGVYDCVFSFDYFPVIARIAQDVQVKYISWVYDSPHHTLYSETLGNSCNEVFSFDPYLVKKYVHNGENMIHYMPLGYNKYKMQQQQNSIPQRYDHEVSFVGSLYADKNDLFGQIRYLPEELRGYIQGLIESQQLIYGYDLIEELFDHTRCEQMGKYVKPDLGKQYVQCRDDIFRDMIRRRITVLERRKLLSALGDEFSLDLYSAEEPKDIRMKYLGYADYYEQMPQIFYSSKINLNISLRSILEGIPLRVIDILGAGGFLLTNYQPDMSNYFENGTDIVWYESKEDLLDKVSYYLHHDKERQEIAWNGHRKAESLFSYENLLTKIFQTVFEVLH